MAEKQGLLRLSASDVSIHHAVIVHLLTLFMDVCAFPFTLNSALCVNETTLSPSSSGSCLRRGAR